MKTLKKTLCLVLAVVMVVGALVLPASAAYDDVDDIDDDYVAAVNNLTLWKVMEGDANGNFKPTGKIQRQEMAAIAYRLLTGDVKDAKGEDDSAKYASYAKQFTDVDAKGWAAGYIGYCVSKGIVVGTNAEGTTFDPARNICATDVLTILLRCIGYTQKDEFTGANWSKEVAARATRLGLTEGITEELGEISTREQVAQMTYKAATAPRVTWSESEQDYIPYTDPNKPGAGSNNIPLIQVGADTDVTYTQDAQWGYFKGTDTTKKVTFTYPVPNVSPVEITSKPAEKSYWEYWEAVTECDVASDTKDAKLFEKTTPVVVWINGYTKAKVTVDEINPLDQVETIGDQGRHTYVTYDPSGKSTEKRVVYVDTFLGVVTGIEEEVTDTNGHVIRANAANLTIYGNKKDANGNNVPVTAKGKIANPSGTTYKKGDRVLVNVLLKADAEAGNLVAGTYYDKDIAATVTDATQKLYNVKPAEEKKVTVSGILGKEGAETGIKDTAGTPYYYNWTFNETDRANSGKLNSDYINEEIVLYLDTEGNIMDWAPVTTAADYGVVTASEFVRVSTGKYALEYEIFTADKTIQTVKTLKLENGSYAFYDADETGSATIPEGTLVSFFPNSANSGYHIVDSGTAARSIGAKIVAGDADGLNATVGSNAVVVNDDTVFFIQRYVLDNKSYSYKSTGYDVVKGFKNIATLEADGRINSVDNTALSAMYINNDEATVVGPDAEYVVINNATKVTTTEEQTVKNYAYITDAKDYKVTEGDKYVFSVFVNGKADTLTVAASSVNTISDNGAGLYTYTAATTTNGACSGFEKVPANGGKKLEGTKKYDSGVIRVVNTATTYHSVAADAKVWLVNQKDGKFASIKQLSLVNDGKYSVRMMYCELDKNGDISTVYIVDTDIADETKPEEEKKEETPVKVTFDLSYDDGIGYAGDKTKGIEVTDGAYSFEVTTKSDVYDIDVSITDPKAGEFDRQLGKATVTRKVAGNDQYTYTIKIEGLTPAKDKDTGKDKDTKYEVHLTPLVLESGKTPPVEAKPEDYGSATEPAAPTAQWSGASALYKALGIEVKQDTTDKSVINVTIEEAKLINANGVYKLIGGQGEAPAAPATIADGTIGYVGVNVGVSGATLQRIRVNGKAVNDPTLSTDKSTYTEFYTSVQYNATTGKWSVVPGTYTVEFDAVKTGDDTTTTHYTYTIKIAKAATAAG